MNRRNFIDKVAKSSALAVFLGNIPVKLLAIDHKAIKAVLEGNSDRILILVQLHGGNDGLNTILPVNQYSAYYNLRPNIAIPDHGSRKFITLDSTLSDNQLVGVHPDMTSFKDLYDQGRATAIQNVGYDNMNLSHFRGRDIMFMGGGSTDNFSSGWMGRYLDKAYPGYPVNYPNSTMPDPLALELGSSFSLAFHRENGIPVGFNIENPQRFYELITGVGVAPPITFPDSHAGDELRYLMEFEKQSNAYAGRLKDAYLAGHNTASVSYPTTYPLNADARFVNNPLSEQLKLIARLISGGLKTRIYLCRLGGFDTHAQQVENYNTTMGAHAALLYHLSSGMKAFQDDLAGQSLEDRVISMTFTEFGRRAYSNASYGTDHGKSFPVLMFGSALKGGVIGNNADLSNLDDGNLRYQIDYRQVYTTLLSDWFGVSNDTLNAIYFGPWANQKLDLIENSLLLSSDPPKNINIEELYPNPVKDMAYLTIKLNSPAEVSLKIYDMTGRFILEKNLGRNPNGYLRTEFETSRLEPGMYQCFISNGNEQVVKKFLKQ